MAKAPPEKDPDLTWLFCESEAALGLRSSYGALVDLALAGVTAGSGSGGPRALSDTRVLDAREERRLRALVGALEPRHRAILWLAYGPQPWPREVRRTSVYGPWPGVLLLCQTAQRMFERAVERRRARADGETSRGVSGRIESLAVCVIDEEGDAPTDIEVPRPLGTMVVRQGQRRTSGQLYQAVVYKGLEAPYERLGPLRDTTLDPVATMLRRGLGEWLRSPSTSGDKALMKRLRDEARALVAEAHGAYARLAVPPVQTETQRRRKVLVPVEEAIA